MLMRRLSSRAALCASGLEFMADVAPFNHSGATRETGAKKCQRVPSGATWSGGKLYHLPNHFWTAFYLSEGSDEGLGSRKGITPPKMKKGKETVKFSMLYQRLTKVTLVPGKETTPNHIWNFDHQEAYPGFRS